VITNRTFIPAVKRFYEVIENGEVSLVYKWKCRISEKGKEGTLGLSTDAPSVYQMKRISFDAREWSLGVDREAVASIEVKPYMKTKSKFVFAKNASAFFKSFPDKRTEIKTYLDQNPVDFRKEADLRRMIVYCNSLKV